MPGKAMLFNCKCEPVFDFGTGHRNAASYNLQGSNILTITLKTRDQYDVFVCVFAFVQCRGRGNEPRVMIDSAEITG